MEIKRALKGQYHAGLAMLREVIEKCPDDLWLAGTHPRNTWRIAYHAVFYTHVYLQVDEAVLEPWEKWPQVRLLWDDDEGNPPPIEPPLSKAEVLDFLDHVNAGVDGWVDLIDLDSPSAGFSWYSSIPKLDHQILNIRHLGGHVGQLSEIVMTYGADLDWISVR